jgi:TonB family protein
MQKVSKFVSLLIILLVALSVGMAAQQATTSNPERKVTTRVNPDYPELAKRMHIHGIVKIEAIVRPAGTVRSARVLGGNPVLADAAVSAVQKWKFEPAGGETTEVVQVTFDSQ